LKQALMKGINLEEDKPVFSTEDVTKASRQSQEVLTKWLPEPKSIEAKAVLQGAETLIKPITFLTDKIEKLGVDTGNPNLGMTGKFLAEMLMFKYVHVKGKEGTRLIKKKLKVINRRLKKGKNLKEVQTDIDSLLDEVKDVDIKSTEFKAYQEDLGKVTREAREAKEGTERQRALQAELDKNLPIEKAPLEPLVYPEKPLDSGVKAKTALEQADARARENFQDVPVRPNLGRDIEMRTAELPPEIEKIGGRAELVESIPRNEYQITDGKVERTYGEGERSVHKIDEFGKPNLVEHVPGVRSVYQIAIDPMKSQKGSVDIEVLKGLLGVGAKGIKEGSVYNKLISKGVSAEDLQLSGLSYLRGGMGKTDFNKVKKIADEGGFEVKTEVLEGKKTRNLTDPEIVSFIEQTKGELEAGLITKTEATMLIDNKIRNPVTTIASKTKYGPNNFPTLTTKNFEPGS